MGSVINIKLYKKDEDLLDKQIWKDVVRARSRAHRMKTASYMTQLCVLIGKSVILSHGMLPYSNILDMPNTLFTTYIDRDVGRLWEFKKYNPDKDRIWLQQKASYLRMKWPSIIMDYLTNEYKVKNL